MSVRTVKITSTHTTLDILSITTKHNTCPFTGATPVKAPYPRYHLGTNELDRRKGLERQSACRDVQASKPPSLSGNTAVLKLGTRNKGGVRSEVSLPVSMTTDTRQHTCCAEA